MHTINITEILQKNLDPITLHPWKNIHIQSKWINSSNIEITFNYTIQKHIDIIKKHIYSILKKEKPDIYWENINIQIIQKIQSHKIENKNSPLPSVKNIITVFATKGGVGKSTCATNLALALQKNGAKTGLLDADIYGPNIPNLLGANTKATITKTSYEPVYQHNIQTMSMGYLVERQTPLIWKGPMASAYFQQMLTKTTWKDLDYLIIDMPPGTGDIALTACQKAPITACINISTPQSLSIADLEKGIEMFKKMEIPVLGIIENMAGFTCTNCDKITHIFPQDKLSNFANTHKTPILASLPLDPEIVKATENNTPFLISNPDSNISNIFTQIAIRLSMSIASSSIIKKSIFPKIVVESIN